MYTQEELEQAGGMLRKRWWITALPPALVMIAGIVLFVLGRLERSSQMWMVTAALWAVGGAYFLFFYGVYVRPLRLYHTHIHYMLNGRKRETTGVLKSFSEEVNDKEGLDCYPMLLNIGERDDLEDDRLFYFDAHKPKPDMPLGTRVTVISNDKMVADMKVV